MEYTAVASRERLTGRAYFNPGLSGGLGIQSMPWLDLGNVQLMSLDYGIKAKEHLRSRRGLLFADRQDAYSMAPKWEITSDEFTSSLLWLIFLGTEPSSFAPAFQQTAANNQTMTFRVHIGGVFDTGYFGLTNAFISGYTAGYTADYVVDNGPGKIYIPASTSMVEDSQHTLTYSRPALSYDMILPPVNNLSRIGTMQVIEEDDQQLAPKTVHDFTVSLTLSGATETKVDVFKSFKLTAYIIDPTTWKVRKRYS